MKRRLRTGAAALLFLMMGTTATAQTNMLPQLFRELPPELREGLPPEMEYDEYLEMTRSVDFFSMFMAVWVPGYALFGVGEPTLGLGVAGVRAGGAAMILTGILRQWNDFRDIWELSTVIESPERYRRAITNASLMAGGFFINGVAWAFDVATAHRIAENRKSYVQYKYGVLHALDGDAQARQESYIRSLAAQDVEAVGNDLERSLRTYIRTYPDSDFIPEAEYQLGTVLATQEEDEEALLVLLRQLAVRPDPRVTPASRRIAASLVQRNIRAWEADRDTLLELIAAPEASGRNAAAVGAEDTTGEADGTGPAAASRYEFYLDGLRSLETARFRELYAEQAAEFVERYPQSPLAPEVLLTRGDHLAELDRHEEAIIAYTQLAVAYPDSELWSEAMLKAGIGLEEQLGEPEYAARFYRRLVERRPGSREADKARERF
ncbi:MAG: tetratricopeptide repeat protein [Spirochaetaceae bacterium]